MSEGAMQANVGCNSDSRAIGKYAWTSTLRWVALMPEHLEFVKS